MGSSTNDCNCSLYVCLLNQLSPDYFTKTIQTDAVKPCKCVGPNSAWACRQDPAQEKKMVRSLHPPYWQAAPSTGRRPYQSNPFFFVKKYGEPPNPRPWESEWERVRPPCHEPKTFVGHQPDLCPLRLVNHKKPWDKETDVPGVHDCNLWHCIVPHKRKLGPPN